MTTGALYDMIMSCKSTIFVSLTLIFCNLRRIVNINVHVDSKYLHVYKNVHFWRMHVHYVAEIKNVPKLFCQKEPSENVIKGVNCQVSLIFSTCLNGTPLTPPHPLWSAIHNSYIYSAFHVRLCWSCKWVMLIYNWNYIVFYIVL